MVCVDTTDSELVLWPLLVECDGSDVVMVTVWLALVVWPMVVGSDAVEVTMSVWLPLVVCVPALVLPDGADEVRVKV